jgi:hypothetical protein
MTSSGERTGVQRAAADIAIAVLLALYECRNDIDEDMVLAGWACPARQTTSLTPYT